MSSSIDQCSMCEKKLTPGTSALCTFCGDKCNLCKEISCINCNNCEVRVCTPCVKECCICEQNMCPTCLAHQCECGKPVCVRCYDTTDNDLTYCVQCWEASRECYSCEVITSQWVYKDCHRIYLCQPCDNNTQRDRVQYRQTPDQIYNSLNRAAKSLLADDRAWWIYVTFIPGHKILFTFTLFCHIHASLHDEDETDEDIRWSVLYELTRKLPKQIIEDHVVLKIARIDSFNWPPPKTRVAFAGSLDVLTYYFSDPVYKKNNIKP